MPNDIIKKNSTSENFFIFVYFLWFVFMLLGFFIKEYKKSKKKKKYFQKKIEFMIFNILKKNLSVLIFLKNQDGFPNSKK